MSAPLIMLDSGLASALLRCLISSVTFISKAVDHWEGVRLSLTGSSCVQIRAVPAGQLPQADAVSSVPVSENSSVQVAVEDPVFCHGSVARCTAHAPGSALKCNYFCDL